MFAPRFTYLLT